MAFEVVEGEPGKKGRDDPTLAIYANGDGRLNTVATEQWFEGVETVGIYHDSENDRIGINRNDEAPHALSASADANGISISARRVLKAVGASIQDLENSVHLPLEHDPSEGLIVADLDPLLAEVSDVE